MPATVPHRLRVTRRQPGNGASTTHAARFGKLPPVLVLGSQAFTFTFGLLVTFLGIGVIANVLIAYAVIQVLGERQQNEERRSQLDV